ncbi:MAG: radical SAM protein [Methanotrichaceae archaeon]|nr:radical SAM protein [Methanotrichaceae archaeon]
MALIEVDGQSLEVPEGTSIKQLLEDLGFQITMFPSDPGLFMPCQTGGCWSCALDIDGALRPACVSTVQNGMRIETDASSLTPMRPVGGFMGHRVGGVGTPWWLKGEYIEVACFTAGCNFSCPQCQNWRFTYLDAGDPLTPEEAAKQMTATVKLYGVDRIAISGGECTLNRRWLIQYLSLLRDLNPGAHLHVDTNGSILTGDYLDELVEAGMTDIGIDLKALRISTFQEITGLVDESLASRYMQTAWQAVEYMHQNYPMVFLGIGIPYNKDLIGLEEIAEMGQKIADIDPWIQVSALDYRPEFMRLDITRPSYREMFQVYGILRNTGLESVICQTERGRIGPAGRLLS